MRAWLAAAALLLAGMTPVETQEVLDRRQAMMKEMRNELGSFVPMLKGDRPWEAKRVRAAAERIRADAARITTLFPAGTSSERVFTMALPAIWERAAEFEAAAKATEAAARRLVELAPSADGPALSAQVEALTNSCLGCHQSFRLRR